MVGLFRTIVSRCTETETSIGLIPQAPIHTTSLLVMGHPPKKGDEEDRGEEKGQRTKYTGQEEPIAVVEQRFSNLAQGSLCLVLLTGPFLHILNLIPKGKYAAAIVIKYC